MEPRAIRTREQYEEAPAVVEELMGWTIEPGSKDGERLELFALLVAKELLAKSGISMVIEPHLPKTHLDGAAMLVADGGLTLRHDRLDNFWFTTTPKRRRSPRIRMPLVSECSPGSRRRRPVARCCLAAARRLPVVPAILAPAESHHASSGRA